MAPEEIGPNRYQARRLFRGPGSGSWGTRNDEDPKPLGEYSRARISSSPQSIEDALTITQDLPLASELFLGETQKLASCQIASVYSVDESLDEVTAILFGTNLAVPQELGYTLPLAGSCIEQYLQAGLPQIESAKNGKGHLFGGPEYRNAGIKSSLRAPLINDGRLSGIVALHSQDPGAFDDKVATKVTDLGYRLAPSIEMAARCLRARHQEKFAQALHRSSKCLTSALGVQQVLETICRECCNTLGVSYTVLHEVQSGEMVCRAAWPIETPQTYHNQTHRSMNGQAANPPVSVAHTRLPEVMNEAPDHAQMSVGGVSTGAASGSAAMWVPVVARDRAMGVLEFGHVNTGSKFTRCCLQMAEAFAAQAAVALENAQLNRQALQEKERANRILSQLQAVLKEADAGLLLVDDQQQVLWINEKFGEFFGVPRNRLENGGKPLQVQTLWDRDTDNPIDPEAFFAERGRIDADRAYAGYVGELELVHPQARILQEFTAPVYDVERAYVGRLWVYHDVTAQKRNEEALRYSESQQSALLRAIPDAMFRLSKDGAYLSYMSPADFQLLMPPEEFLGKTIDSVMPAEVAQPALKCIAKALSSHQVQTFEYRFAINDHTRDYEARIVANGPEEVLAIVRDVTERKSLEAQFLQSQKLESLGRLAGGIAHDFNNLLGGIMGYSSLLKSRLDPNSEAHEFASIIEKATQRGAQLTQQLLTAARRTRFDSRPMDLNEVTEEVVQILSRTLPRGIAVVSRLQPDLPSVPADHSQIHQVLMNLCINAADAMPNGGTLTIANQKVFLDEDFCRKHLSVEPGQYVQLTVADTGIGISQADLPKIFDPFFTTKEPGKGTGLGLAVVYAIVKNHSGIIEVSSVPGEGSSFIAYLPASSDKQS